MGLAWGLLYIDFIMLRYIPSILNLLRVLKKTWNVKIQLFLPYSIVELTANWVFPLGWPPRQFTASLTTGNLCLWPRSAHSCPLLWLVLLVLPTEMCIDWSSRGKSLFYWFPNLIHKDHLSYWGQLLQRVTVPGDSWQFPWELYHCSILHCC